MDWKLFISIFTTVFIAELGDKTQLVALASSAQTRSTGTVLAAVVLALALAGGLGVIAGRLLGEWINPQVLRTVAGVLFIVLGAWFLLSKEA